MRGRPADQTIAGEMLLLCLLSMLGDHHAGFCMSCDTRVDLKIQNTTSTVIVRGTGGRSIICPLSSIIPIQNTYKRSNDEKASMRTMGASGIG